MKIAFFVDGIVFNIDLGTEYTLEKPNLLSPDFPKSVIYVTFFYSLHDFLAGISVPKFKLSQMHRITKFWLQAETKEHENQTIFNQECGVADPRSLPPFSLAGDPTA